DAPPGSGKDAKLVPVVERITAKVEAMAGASGSELSRGGMLTKIEAGKIATTAGTHMVIAPGRLAPPPQAGPHRAPSHLVLTPTPVPALVPGRPPTRSPRARSGSPARSSRRARCTSMPAQSQRCAAAAACFQPA